MLCQLVILEIVPNYISLIPRPSADPVFQYAKWKHTASNQKMELHVAGLGMSLPNYLHS